MDTRSPMFGPTNEMDSMACLTKFIVCLSMHYFWEGYIDMRWELTYTSQKMKFSIKGFCSNCDQIRGFLQIWSHLLKKSLMENFIFCAVVSFKMGGEWHMRLKIFIASFFSSFFSVLIRSCYFLIVPRILMICLLFLEPFHVCNLFCY